MHWHMTGLTKGMGTVEVTYAPETGKLDVSVHDNRRGYWALSASRDLAKALRLTTILNRGGLISTLEM